MPYNNKWQVSGIWEFTTTNYCLTKFEVGNEAAIPINWRVSAGKEMVSPLLDESVVTRLGDVADVV